MGQFRVFEINNKKYSNNSEIDGDCFVLTENGQLLWYCDEYETCEAVDDNNYTIEQSTGLKDKNGKVIFEGDIIKHTIGDDHPWSGKHEVVFNMGAFKLKGGNPYGFRYGEIMNYSPYNVIIIGNIHNV